MPVQDRFEIINSPNRGGSGHLLHQSIDLRQSRVAPGNKTTLAK
jgi:hypothetical protein